MSSDCLKKREHILPDSSPNEFCRRVPERAQLYSLSFSVLALSDLWMLLTDPKKLFQKLGLS